MSLYVIGTDPGPTTGVVGLAFRDDRHPVPPAIFQTTSSWAVDLVGWLVDAHQADYEVVLAVESFVVRQRAARLSNPGDGKTTQRLVQDLVFAFQPRIRVVAHPAGVVKPWAIDARLEAAGVLEHCVGMRHAKDAGRHALYAATHDYGIPDPLSKRFREP